MFIGLKSTSFILGTNETPTPAKVNFNTLSSLFLVMVSCFFLQVSNYYTVFP